MRHTWYQLLRQFLYIFVIFRHRFCLIYELTKFLWWRFRFQFWRNLFGPIFQFFLVYFYDQSLLFCNVSLKLLGIGLLKLFIYSQIFEGFQHLVTALLKYLNQIIISHWFFLFQKLNQILVVKLCMVVISVYIQLFGRFFVDFFNIQIIFDVKMLNRIHNKFVQIGACESQVHFYFNMNFGYWVSYYTW